MLSRDDLKWYWSMAWSFVARFATLTPSKVDDRLIVVLEDDDTFEEFYQMLKRKGVVA